MGILGAFICIGFFFLVLFDFQQELPEKQRPRFMRWLLGWAIRGLLTPVLLWILFDGAILDSFPTFSPSVEYAKLSGDHFDALCDVAATGLRHVGSYWAALTSAWLLAALWQRAEHPDLFKTCVLRWSIFLGPMAGLMILAFGWGFAGTAITLWMLPVLQRVLHLKPESAVKPIYSQALAKLHFDKHAEAEAAVLEELDKCENDFEGWLFLADLYANHFNDLAGAEQILRETCDHPATSPSDVAVAFHRLADWHLKLARDPVAARQALWEICRRYPKSHLDHMARLRVEQVPMSKEEFVQQHTAKTISLPVSPKPWKAEMAPSDRPDAALQRARACIERLRQDPDDLAQREDLARIFTEELNAVDRGMEQLEQLLALPDPPAGKMPRWLLLMAVWKLEHKKDRLAARKLFEQVARVFPQTQEACAAQTRLGLMEAEERLRDLQNKPNSRPA